MIIEKNRNVKKRHVNHGRIGEITFPPLPNVGSSDPIIIKVYILGRQVNREYLDRGREQSWPLGKIPLEVTIGEGPIAVTKTLTFVIVKSDSPHNLLLGRTAMQQMGIVVSTDHGAIKFHTPKGIGTIFSEYNSQKPKEEEDDPTNKYQGNEKNVLSCIDTKERMVINDKTSIAKEEKPSPRKKQSDPQPGRRIDRSRDLARRATYQKLIDKVFSHQMGRNMEVNTDDMVIKSDSEEEMMADIIETLERLQAINLKLNPKNAPLE
ncbi:hypothetical protein Tco_1074494 [Tanacetum coccineum]